jgi:hypothetical protein
MVAAMRAAPGTGRAKRRQADDEHIPQDGTPGGSEMVIDRHSAVDDIAAALETGRRELASVDLGKVRDDAWSAARSALPVRPARPRSRRRWPLLAALLGIGGAVAGWFLLPEVRLRVNRVIADRRATAGEPATQGAQTVDGEMAPERPSYLREMAGSPA